MPYKPMGGILEASMTLCRALSFQSKSTKNNGALRSTVNNSAFKAALETITDKELMKLIIARMK